jgi:hypothetical protein
MQRQRSQHVIWRLRPVKRPAGWCSSSAAAWSRCFALVQRAMHCSRDAHGAVGAAGRVGPTALQLHLDLPADTVACLRPIVCQHTS